MEYGKLIDGALYKAPRKIKSGASVTYNPDAETLKGLGYKPVVRTEAPEAPEGYYARSSFIEEGDSIVQVWEVCEEELGADEIQQALEAIL